MFQTGNKNKFHLVFFADESFLNPGKSIRLIAIFITEFLRQFGTNLLLLLIRET